MINHAPSREFQPGPIATALHPAARNYCSVGPGDGICKKPLCPPSKHILTARVSVIARSKTGAVPDADARWKRLPNGPPQPLPESGKSSPGLAGQARQTFVCKGAVEAIDESQAQSGKFEGDGVAFPTRVSGHLSSDMYLFARWKGVTRSGPIEWSEGRSALSFQIIWLKAPSAGGGWSIRPEALSSVPATQMGHSWAKRGSSRGIVDNASALFMLVSALMGLATLQAAYKHAIKEGYRSYS